MSKRKTVLAFDFGASSGRAMMGHFDGNTIDLEEVHRFSNDPVMFNGTFHWDFLRQFFEIKQGLLKAKHNGPFASVGIDTWGVDFGLLDDKGNLVENPVHYRDARTNGAAADFAEQVMPAAELYKRTGIQQMDINTIYQLYVIKRDRPELLERAATALMTPDLFTYALTGLKGSEYTIASTSSLVDVAERDWDRELFDKLGIKPDLFPPIVMPGTVAGPLSDALREELSLEPVPVIRIGSHDTASAVLAVPAKDDDFIYISSGTWSLMGVENDDPTVDELSEKYMFTNEGGFGGKIRYLKNIMGLWLIQETRRQFRREGMDVSYADMEHAAVAKPAFRSFVDVDEAIFAPPGDMPARIRQRCRETGQPVPADMGEVVRCVYESLALKYRYTKESIERCTGKTYSKINVVGGGTKDGLLSQFTANATGSTVEAGPIEATAMGNVAGQLIALGEIKDREEARAVIGNSFELKHYQPENTAAWDEAYARFLELYS